MAVWGQSRHENSGDSTLQGLAFVSFMSAIVSVKMVLVPLRCSELLLLKLKDCPAPLVEPTQVLDWAWWVVHFGFDHVTVTSVISSGACLTHHWRTAADDKMVPGALTAASPPQWSVWVAQRLSPPPAALEWFLDMPGNHVVGPEAGLALTLRLLKTNVGKDCI